jgi:hypothetical protein
MNGLYFPVECSQLASAVVIHTPSSARVDHPRCFRRRASVGPVAPHPRELKPFIYAEVREKSA